MFALFECYSHKFLFFDNTVTNQVSYSHAVWVITSIGRHR